MYLDYLQLRAFLPIVILILALSSPVTRGDDAANASLPDRFGFVYKLLHESSAAKKVETSESVGARTLHKEAHQIYDQAKTAYESGDEAAVTESLNLAAKKMFEAARAADKGKFSDEKRREDFASRLESINVLVEALERVSKEKGVGSQALHDQVHQHIRRADELLADGNVDDARFELDKGYVVAKIAIEGLRGGDTLVRTLSFATVEEEYHYEIDRNDTHKMLITVLVKQKQGDSQGALGAKFMEAAEALRKQAESMAGSGEFEQAIKTLEASTKNYTRAIRSAGIYIPG